MKKRLFLINAMILMLSSFLLRLMNIGFRVFLSNRIGAAGMGLYQLIFSVFTTAITLSTAGMSLAVTRITSEAVGRGEPGSVPSAIRKCALCGVGVSLSVAVLLYLLSGPIADRLLGDSRAAPALRILAPGLPCMTLCACFKGYFLAVRKAMHSAIGELLEQAVTVGVPILLFLCAAPEGLENAAKAVMLGSTLGEFTSLIYTYICYKIHLAREKQPRRKSRGVLRAMAHIALPSTVGSTARTLLNTAENLLIPFGLKRSGMDAALSMERYGVLQGMSMPMLVFPSACLLPFSSLLVPELAEARARGAVNAVSHTASRSMQMALLFAIPVAGIFFGFAPDFGEIFYHSAEAGDYLRILSPLVPLLYLDAVVDGILKGLDEQVSSLRYNLADAALRVALIYTLLPVFGLRGYLTILFFSTIFNASLSLNRLRKVARIELPLKNCVIKPALCAAFAVLAAKVVGAPCWPAVALSVLLYVVFLSVSRCFSAEERAWLRGLFRKTQTPRE